MNEREDVWPIMLRWLPARSTMQDWARSVDDFLVEKARLDRQKAQRVEQTNQTTRGQGR